MATEYESEVAELLESLEAESAESEAAERSGRRFPTPRTPPRGGLPGPRPESRYVTQVQFTTGINRLDAKIGTVSESIKTVNTRLNTINAERARADAALKKEIDERKKASDTQQKDFNQKVQLLALLPLLVKPTASQPLTAAVNALPQGTKVLIQSDDTLTALLPLLLVGGFGGSGGLGLGGESGSDGTLPILALALALGKP